VTKSKFTIFKDEFTKWQGLFGLYDYEVYFKYEPIGDKFACIYISQNDMNAVVTLNSKVPELNKQFVDIKSTAKHEALHLLVDKLISAAKYRYTPEIEIDELNEALVNKLCKLIK
jgi:hypothetical protein